SSNTSTSYRRENGRSYEICFVLDRYAVRIRTSEKTERRARRARSGAAHGRPGGSRGRIDQPETRPLSVCILKRRNARPVQEGSGSFRGPARRSVRANGTAGDRFRRQLFRFRTQDLRVRFRGLLQEVLGEPQAVPGIGAAQAFMESDA